MVVPAAMVVHIRPETASTVSAEEEVEPDNLMPQPEQPETALPWVERVEVEVEAMPRTTRQVEVEVEADTVREVAVAHIHILVPAPMATSLQVQVAWVDMMAGDLLREAAEVAVSTVILPYQRSSLVPAVQVAEAVN